MALWRNTRFDGRKSSPYCSTATIVVFVTLCLVGVWMMTSTTVVPVEDITTPETSAEVKDQVNDTNTGMKDPVQENNAGSFEDNQEDTTPETSTEVKDQANDTNTGTKDPVQEDNAGSFEDNQGDMPEDDRNSGTDGDTNASGDSFPGIEVPKDDINDAKANDSGEDGEVKGTGQKPGGFAIDGQQGQPQKDLDGAVNGDEERQPVTNEINQIQLDKNVDEKRKNGTELSSEGFPDGAESGLLNETNTQTNAWSTQASQSDKEKLAQASTSPMAAELSWKLCNTSAGADYIPCLDNEVVIRKLRSTMHYEHRERHCPEAPPTCLVPLPDGYLRTIKWPSSRDKIWFKNVPHTELVIVKGHQNWVKVSGDFLTFPGGGTQFTKGALQYIDNIQQTLRDIEWGKQSRVVLDVGCGVASFGGYLFDRDTVTMSFAPKDEHEAQVQFALERGIPAISAVMGTKRLPFPSMVFDVIHCARCRVPWHIDGGMLLLELNRLLRPGGYFVWSATPVYQKKDEDAMIWRAMSDLTMSMCWDLVVKSKDKFNKVGVAIYRKPLDNTCYDKRKENNPALCPSSDDPNAAWNVPLQACMHRVPVDPSVRGRQWPAKWPERLEKTPYWLNGSQIGVYGKPAPDDFQADYEHWKRVVGNSYRSGMGIDWTNVRNVMDMRAVYGGFAAAMRDMNVWVMNVVTIDSPDTLPIIYERGLFGLYHNWCESFSTYPRTYDLLHADHLFSRLKLRCGLPAVMAEVDRVLRPEGKLIVRDDLEAMAEVEGIARSLHWEVRLTFSKEDQGLLCLEKTAWRPLEVDGSLPS